MSKTAFPRQILFVIAVTTRGYRALLLVRFPRSMETGVKNRPATCSGAFRAISPRDFDVSTEPCPAFGIPVVHRFPRGGGARRRARPGRRPGGLEPGGRLGGRPHPGAAARNHRWVQC